MKRGPNQPQLFKCSKQYHPLIFPEVGFSVGQTKLKWHLGQVGPTKIGCFT